MPENNKQDIESLLKSFKRRAGDTQEAKYLKVLEFLTEMQDRFMQLEFDIGEKLHKLLDKKGVHDFEDLLKEAIICEKKNQKQKDAEIRAIMELSQLKIKDLTKRVMDFQGQLDSAFTEITFESGLTERVISHLHRML